jgi:hypothetical protein
MKKPRAHRPYKPRDTTGAYTVRGYDENGKVLFVLDLERAENVRDARAQTVARLNATRQGMALITIVTHLEAVKKTVKVPGKRGRRSIYER